MALIKDFTVESMPERTDILLIGGTGFIGSELARAFIGAGKKVVSIGRHPKEDNYGKVEVADASDLSALEQAWPTAETVFILTGQNKRDFDEKKEMKMLQNIVNVLNGRLPKKVFYLSSVLVYGDVSAPARENNTCKPLEKYSQFKYQAEIMLQQTLNKKILLGILRLGNVYGNPANRGFIHWLILAVKNKQKLILTGEGLQERDYVFIDDVVDTLLGLEDKLLQSDTINVASGKSTSLIEVVKVMERVVEKSIPFEVNHQSVMEVQTSRVDVSKLQGCYSLKLSQDLCTGLGITLNRYLLAG